MKPNYQYPDITTYEKTLEQIIEYIRLKAEYKSPDLDNYCKIFTQTLEKSLDEIKSLPIDSNLSMLEPDDLAGIKKLRPDGPRRLWTTFDETIYQDKLEGALLSRMAGCTLGAPVEFHSVDGMKHWAKYHEETFPPNDYWKKIKSPYDLRYEKSTFQEYTREGITRVPVDDDITYTLLGLLIMEDYGLEFTTQDVGNAWLKYLPYACTAEDIALKNLKKQIPADQSADVNNPYCQWIGADIRCDSFAYITPGWPEKAAELAYRDAILSHRRNGVYGEMFFAAAISAAFAVDDSLEAIRIALTEIPEHCSLAIDVRWALSIAKTVPDYKEARRLVDLRFQGMSVAHTNNNACLTIFGLAIGGMDMSRVIGETVAMGLDNDCTAATAGSIIGAIVGKNQIPIHWYEPFHNQIDHYLIGLDPMKIDDVVNRLKKLVANSLINE